MTDDKQYAIETLAIHAGHTPDATTGAVMPPIYQNSTYQQNGPGEPRGGYEYSRTGNPTRTALETNLAALEGAKHGLAFASGCAAGDALLHTLKQGDHVVAFDDVYGGTFRLFHKVFARLGVAFTHVDLTDASNLDAALRPDTRLIWIETPSNPLLKLVDVAAICRRAHKARVPVVVDNTFATPYLQRPLELGADVVLHSTTKYLGGHSDVIGGALMTNDGALHDELKFMQNAVGAVPAPFDCFLVMRGIKTLHVRMDRHQENARRVAEFLAGHAAVERVIFPGLETHPQHTLMKQQMRGPGAMVTFVARGGFDGAKRVMQRVRLFALAESLGGVESLMGHPVTMSHGSVPKELRDRAGIVDGMIRLSIGIENGADLVADLAQALG